MSHQNRRSQVSTASCLRRRPQFLRDGWPSAPGATENAAAAVSAEGGVRKERKRRRGQRARPGRKIVRDAIKRAHPAV